MTYTRYAVYWTPAEGPLQSLGAAWLGWDSATGQEVPHPEIASLPVPVSIMTETPRKYGLHGTIKPPFFLAAGAGFEDLRRDLSTLCASLSPIRLDGLKVSRIGQFMALTPVGDTSELAQMAGRVVKGLDLLRAPPSEAELTRRRAAGLTPAQETNLQNWGYPYVMDEFRFHITLTGSLEPQIAAAVGPILTELFDPITDEECVVDDLTLLGQDNSGRFLMIERFSLGG